MANPAIKTCLRAGTGIWRGLCQLCRSGARSSELRIEEVPLASEHPAEGGELSIQHAEFKV
jgi:hypothetical protein